MNATDETETKAYFAYGSNTNLEDWRIWCEEKRHPEAEGLLQDPMPCRALDWELVFDVHSERRKGGVLNLRPRKGQLTPGVLFEVNETGWSALDEKEGCPGKYQRIEIWVLTDNQELVKAITYVVPEEKTKVPPSEEYYKIVRRGYNQCHLDHTMLDLAYRKKHVRLPTDALFVYGTLMRGEDRFSVIQSFGLECVLLAERPGRLVDCGSYPGMLEARNANQWVKGEFIRVEKLEKALEVLDEIEGFRSPSGQTSGGDCLFHRRLVEVGMGDGHVRQAWAYFLNGTDERTVIPSGDWREHNERASTFLEMLCALHSGGDERSLVQRIVQLEIYQIQQEDESFIARLLPLHGALSRGWVSERKIAQASGKWAAIP